MLLIKFSSTAAIDKIDPRMGPIQGVQPKPKAAPTIKGKVKLSLYWLVKILSSLFRNFKLMIPINCNEKKIIIIPAITLKVLEFFKKNCPRRETVNPKAINTIEKPNEKKNSFDNYWIIFFFDEFF